MMFFTGQIAPYWFRSITNRLLFLLSLHRFFVERLRCRCRRRLKKINTSVWSTASHTDRVLSCMQQTHQMLYWRKTYSALSVFLCFIMLRHLTFYCKPIGLELIASICERVYVCNANETKGIAYECIRTRIRVHCRNVRI